MLLMVCSQGYIKPLSGDHHSFFINNAYFYQFHIVVKIEQFLTMKGDVFADSICLGRGCDVEDH